MGRTLGRRWSRGYDPRVPVGTVKWGRGCLWADGAAVMELVVARVSGPDEGRRAVRPFTWVDGVILAGSVAVAGAAVVAEDDRFLALLSFHGSREMAWPGLPG